MGTHPTGALKRTLRASTPLAAALVVWAYASEAEAQFQKDLFEASVVGGFRWGGNADIDKGGQDGRITVEGAPSFGASIGVRTDPDGVIYVWYSRQSTTLELRPQGVSGPFPTRDVTFEYLHLGGYVEGEYGISIPYLGLSVGLTRMDADDVGSEWRFSAAAELGFKIPVTSFLHVRLLGRAPVTFMTGNTEVYCVTPQGCGVSLVAKPIAQVELMGGLGVSF